MLLDPVQKIVEYSFFWHPHHMAKPSEPSCSYKSINRGDLSPLSIRYVSIRYYVIKPFDFQDSSQTSMMKHLKSFHLRLRGIPCLTSIKQYSKDSRFVYPDFGWCLDVAAVPYTAKLIECPRGLRNSS